MKTTKTAKIELNNANANKHIESFASRISGKKPTVSKLMNMFQVVLPEHRPSKEYVREYLKHWDD